jgi:hypothetical protein
VALNMSKLRALCRFRGRVRVFPLRSSVLPIILQSAQDAIPTQQRMLLLIVAVTLTLPLRQIPGYRVGGAVAETDP